MIGGGEMKKFLGGEMFISAMAMTLFMGHVELFLGQGRVNQIVIGMVITVSAFGLILGLALAAAPSRRRRRRRL